MAQSGPQVQVVVGQLPGCAIRPMPTVDDQWMPHHPQQFDIAGTIAAGKRLAKSIPESRVSCAINSRLPGP